MTARLPSVFGFLAALEVRGLGDHPTAKHTDSNRVRTLFHALSNIVEYLVRQGPK